MPPKARAKTSYAPSRLSCFAPVPDGEKPAEFVAHFTKLTAKQKAQLHESLTMPTRMGCTGFLENLDKNRAPIPINEKRRVKAAMLKEGDVEYVPAAYAKLERDDYVIWQAPTKENYLHFWRSVWQENVKLILSMSDKFSETDPDLCYAYFPQKEGVPMSIQGGRFVAKLTKRTEQKGYSVYELEVNSADVDDAPGAKKGGEKSTEEEEGGDDDKKTRQITIIHYENWAQDTWPNIDTLAACIQAVAKKEVQLMRKHIDQFAPPVLIQGHSGIGRTAVAWVNAILMKDIEKKDCFDIPDLIRKFMRLRPGSFTNKLYYCVAYAVGFRCAGIGGWMSEEESRRLVKEAETAYKSTLK